MWRKRSLRGLALALGLALPGPASALDEEALRLLRSPRLEDARMAVEIFETRVAESPGDFESQLGAALALNQVMAIRTHGNLPKVDGLQDSDANKALWAELGSRALGYARQAQAQRPDSPEAASALATSYMFYASSLGIIRSIVTGAGGEYQTHAQRLIDLDPGYDDALGDTLLASLFLVAPWPVGDDDTALEHYQKALKLAPESARNHYSLGVYWARNGDPKQARSFFERVGTMPCSANSEQLFCQWMKQESRRALAQLK